jgi:hypothetical protein
MIEVKKFEHDVYRIYKNNEPITIKWIKDPIQDSIVKYDNLDISKLIVDEVIMDELIKAGLTTEEAKDAIDQYDRLSNG